MTSQPDILTRRGPDQAVDRLADAVPDVWGTTPRRRGSVPADASRSAAVDLRFDHQEPRA